MDDPVFFYKLSVFHTRNGNGPIEHTCYLFSAKKDIMEDVWNAKELGPLAFGDVGFDNRIINDIILEEVYIDSDLDFEFFPAGFEPHWSKLINEYVENERKRLEEYTKGAAKILAQSLVAEPSRPMVVKNSCICGLRSIDKETHADECPVRKLELNREK